MVVILNSNVVRRRSYDQIELGAVKIDSENVLIIELYHWGYHTKKQPFRQLIIPLTFLVIFAMLVTMELNKIYLGDTLETLRSFPDNTFDITVTSPPYNKMGVAGGLVEEVKYLKSSDREEENRYQANQCDILEQLLRVTKPHGHLFYNHKLRWVNGRLIHPMEWLFMTKWDLRQELIWDRQIAAQLRGWRFWQTEERIYWMQKGLVKGEELASRHAMMTSVWRIRPENQFPDHPAPFPIELPTRCIYSIANETTGLTILDPYCGTGSTLAAAASMNHKYVGIDCSEEYIAIANTRLQDLRKSGDIERICAEQNLHNVKQTYQERKKKKHEKSKRS